MSTLERITKKDLELTAISNNKEMETFGGLKLTIDGLESYRRLISPENAGMPAILFISGSSESGKSTFGKLAVESGIGHRLKIYKTLAEVRDEGITPNTGPYSKYSYEYATWLESNSSLVNKAGEGILTKYRKLISETDVPILVVETIKHRWMVDYFRNISTIRFLSISIDADLEKRISREVEKTGRSINEIRAEVLRKDEWKQVLGSEGIDKMVDMHILNNGDYKTYRQMVVSFLEVLRDSTRNYLGRANDYS